MNKDPRDLRPYHHNPRTGRVPEIAASLRENGQYRPIIVNVGTHTGRPNEVLAGNHTLAAVLYLADEHPDDPRWSTILVHEVDVGDDQAARIVLADNRTSDLGRYDDAVLADLLEQVSEAPAALDGTGYTDDDLHTLLSRLDPPDLSDFRAPGPEDTGGVGDNVDAPAPAERPRRGVTCPGCHADLTADEVERGMVGDVHL